jgi:chemotaxis response regulator CheB
LESDGRIEIVGEGQTAAEALRLVQTHRPDVLLLGLNAVGDSATADSPLLTCEAIRQQFDNSSLR